MKRIGRTRIAVSSVLTALAAVGAKLALDAGGPYLDALPDHPVCIDAE